MLSSWGDGKLVMPHGLAVDHRAAAIWVTDVGRHQVSRHTYVTGCRYMQRWHGRCSRFAVCAMWAHAHGLWRAAWRRAQNLAVTPLKRCPKIANTGCQVQRGVSHRPCARQGVKIQSSLRLRSVSIFHHVRVVYTGHQVQHGGGGVAGHWPTRQAGPRHRPLLQAHLGALSALASCGGEYCSSTSYHLVWLHSYSRWSVSDARCSCLRCHNSHWPTIRYKCSTFDSADQDSERGSLVRGRWRFPTQATSLWRTATATRVSCTFRPLAPSSSRSRCPRCAIPR